MNKKIFLSTFGNFVFATATTFAAANPFGDVPAGHWAYESVAKLAAEGIVEGYGDGNFFGERNITRYEMAQIIAKALAKNPGNSELEKLAAEFRPELENLGVKVAELEKNSDTVKWTGELSYEYLNTRIQDGIDDGTDKNKWTLDLYPEMKINEHWSAKSQIEIYLNHKYNSAFSDEYDGAVEAKQIYAEGNYKNFTVQFGKTPLFSETDFGALIDSEAPGGEIIFGDKYKLKIFAGTYVSLPYFFTEFYNDRNEKFNFGIGYHRLKNHGYRNIVTDTNGFYDDDRANIFTAGLKYKFGKYFALALTYAQNPSGKNYAATQRRSYSAEISYRDIDLKKPGSYKIFAAYRKFGHMAIIEPTYRIELIGVKGFHVGGEYVLAKNTSLQLEYFTGERVSPRYQGKHTTKIYGNLTWNF